MRRRGFTNDRLLLHLPTYPRKLIIPVINWNEIKEQKYQGKSISLETAPWRKANHLWKHVELSAFLPNHPNILEVIGVSQQNGNMIVVTPSVKKLNMVLNSLDDFSIFTQISSAFEHLHSHNVIHGNLRASNLLFSDENNHQIKIGNFENSCFASDDKYVARDDTISLYTPPEVILNPKSLPSKKTDIYSFGMLLFELSHRNTNFSSFSLTDIGNGWRPKWEFPNTILKCLAERCWSSDLSSRPDFAEIFEVLHKEFPMSGYEDSPKHPFSTQFKTGSASSIGHQRPTMEDSLSILELEDGRILSAVFDGLRGKDSSIFCARMAFLCILEELYSNEKSQVELIRLSFERTDQALSEVIPQVNCGTTATVSITSSSDLTLGWLGDSNAYLFRKVTNGYQAVSLVDRHSPNRPDEYTRITKHNGFVGRQTIQKTDGEQEAVGPWRLIFPKSGLGLAVSRTHGLFQFRPLVGKEPEFVELKLSSQDLCLVVASDGLWDVLDLNIIFQTLLHSKTSQDAAENLIEKVHEYGSFDNVSISVLFFGAMENLVKL